MNVDFGALEQAAREVARRAYCPYSRFPVGAAVLTAEGRVFAGCNVENASSGLALCAERGAVAQAVAAGHSQLVALVVFTPTPTPTAPCGACRQVLHEFAPRLPVRCVCDGPDVLDTTLDQLLPRAFDAGNLRPLA